MLNLDAIKARFKKYQLADPYTVLNDMFDDIRALLGEVERLQALEQAAEELDLLRDIGEYMGHVEPTREND